LLLVTVNYDNAVDDDDDDDDNNNSNSVQFFIYLLAELNSQ
jgi:hypothetical protein